MDEIDQKAFVGDLHLVLRQCGELLLGLRRNTGFGEGRFHLPAGRLEEGETLLEGMIREAREELAIEIAERELSLVHVMLHSPGRIAFFCEAAHWAGEVTNNEPDKCAELRWFPADRLPVNFVPYARDALVMIAADERVSSFGWSRQ